MSRFPKKLYAKLADRKAAKALRNLGQNESLIDFSSNDYLGFAQSSEIFEAAHRYLTDNNLRQNGATGSRLLSGNHRCYQEVESLLSTVHKSEAALIFNSGYDANIGFFSSVPQRGDLILYDEFIHASIRDGIKMSNARSYKFKHNNLDDLKQLMIRHPEFVSASPRSIYVVTESVFSMDGDTPDLNELVALCETYTAYLIIDEAHAVGVFDDHGQGLVQELGLEKKVFARLVTFGKALGCHGAAILANEELIQYLVNFARSFIYTTALPPHSLATIKAAYQQLVISNGSEKSQLLSNIQHFKTEVKRLNLNFIASNSAIHSCIITGNEQVKKVAEELYEKGYDIKPILSPTVPTGTERLRFCLHAYNSKQEITGILENLATFVSK